MTKKVLHALDDPIVPNASRGMGGLKNPLSNRACVYSEHGLPVVSRVVTLCVTQVIGRCLAGGAIQGHEGTQLTLSCTCNGVGGCGSTIRRIVTRVLA